MEGSGGPLDEARDAWMRRAGPFYGLLIAARGQTRLPLAPELEPTGDDRARGVPWFPAVGAIAGLALGFAAAVFGQLGLAAPVVAALIACLWVIAGGGWSELGAARAADRLVSRDCDGESGSLTVAIVIAVAASLLLRVTALVGVAPGAWTEALIVSPVVARFTPVAGALTRSLLSMRKGGDGDPASLPVALLIAAGLVAAVAIAAGGAAGFTAFVIALGLGAGATLLGKTDSDASLILAAELAALICFAAADTYPLL